jgi:CHAT domain-containing protein
VFESHIPPNFATQSAGLIRSLSDLNWLKDSMALAQRIYLENASTIFNWVLASPIKDFEKVTRFIIVPDGVLGRIPFSALLTRPYQGDWRDTKLPLVLKEYAVGYLYSSALLEKSGSTIEGKYKFGGFGSDYRDPLTITGANADTSRFPLGIANWLSRGNLVPLDNADDEVDSLARLTNGDKWLNNAATKYNFQKYGASYGILHIALHTVESPPNDASGFYFLFNKANKIDDNYLSANELASMRLEAKLAVLSACFSGSGTIHLGEGMMNLGRAFALSGCPSTVVNLWQANDAISKKIMIGFYQGLKANLPKDIALQRTQMAFLEHTPSEWAAPFFWANFVMMGDASPISFETKKSWWNISL